MADLKKAHRTISELIEPVLHLAFIYDRINGKLVGALEIDGCDDRPYIVGQNFSETLSRGQCWVREDRQLRDIQPADLARTNTPDTAEEPVKPAKLAKPGKPPPLAVGFNEQPDCRMLEMVIPDTSEPPFPEEKVEVKQPLDLKKTIKEKLGTVTTRILRLGGTQKHKAAAGPNADDQIEEFDGSETVLADANNHYFFEEKALQLNVCICNMGADSIENVSIKLGFPRIPDFDVVDRLYISPFDKRSPQEVKNLGYPAVERRDDAVMVRGTIDRLAPGSPKQAFKCALRLAVGPAMRRKKIAILYTLRGPDKRSLGKGRLKIKFGQAATS